MRHPWRWFESLDRWRAALVIFAIALATRGGLLAVTQTYLKVERYELERAAISLAQHGTLANPYLIPTGPTAHVPPGYPLILAAIFGIFGTGHAGEFVKQFCSAAVVSAQYALLPVVCPAFGIPRRVGLLAALFGALLPMKYSTEVLGDWEAPYAALALLLLLYAAALTWRERSFGARRGFFQGLGWGIAFLITPGLMPVFGAVLALGFMVRARGLRAPYARYAAAGIGGAALCLLPWAIRNEAALGAPVITRSNFGLEIRLSNNDLAGPLEPENYTNGVYHAFHPLQNLREAQAVRSMGEVAYNSDRLKKGIQWIRCHPERFAWLTAWRALYTWFPNTRVRWRDLISDALTLGCLMGLVLLWRRERDFALLLAGALLTYTPLYYLIHVNGRHRYPVDWIILLVAFYGFTAAYQRIVKPLREPAAAHTAQG
ncbi:MAG TPA: hypothetical protein VF767_11600 [Bryobacteraceae bacterium]